MWIGFVVLQVDADSWWRFDVELVNFRNDRAVTSSGECCEGEPGANGQCSSQCRTFFWICLKHFMTHVSPDPPCTFGAVTTSSLGENSFRVPSGSRGNPASFEQAFSWQVSPHQRMLQNIKERKLRKSRKTCEAWR